VATTPRYELPWSIAAVQGARSHGWQESNLRHSVLETDALAI
jgi:hypothetical protein